MTKRIYITLLTFTPSFGVCFVARLYPIICLASFPTTLGLIKREEKKINTHVENHFKAESILHSLVHTTQGALSCLEPMGLSAHILCA